jgi:hypothetical protein
MQKTITTYTINVLAEDAGQIGAQILFYGAGNIFSGRIDFYRADSTPATSYLWHPTSTTDPNQIYLVLSMRMDAFDGVASLVRNEGPWAMELWPSKTPLVGASTPGYSGKIFTANKEPIGEEERSFQSGMAIS